MDRFTVPIIVQVLPEIKPTSIISKIEVSITPASTESTELKLNHKFTVNTTAIEVNLSDAIIATAADSLSAVLNNYVDEDRALKTLVNYGEDRQSVILGSRYGPYDNNSLNTIQLKLLQPVPTEINEGDTVFLSREVAKTLIDKLRVRFAPQIDTVPYLRPKNLRASNNVETGNSISNVTLKTLQLKSGSVGLTDVYQNKTFEDQIFRQWYSYDFNSAELNIDFTDYKNFVFYGSAGMRLEAFRQKLISLENIEQARMQFLSSSAYTVSTSSAAYMFVQEKTAQYAKQAEDIIRGFDRYEQHLYFTTSGSNSPYTASFEYADSGQEYNSISYWPKDANGLLYKVSNEIANNWYVTQSAIAQRFDEFNENNIVNTIPAHVREDTDSESYITFVSMIGHFFDNIKPYVDQLPTIYSRNLDPNEELSKDLITEIAESVGFKLPSISTTYSLTNNILGTNDKLPRRDLTAEIYKRLLHNLPFFAKAKGTKTALDTFIKTFGIGPQLISIKETGTPVTGSYYSFDEFSTGLDFDETKISYIRLPIKSSERNPTFLQFNSTFAKNKTMTVLTGDDKWALNVAVHPSASYLGRIEITSGSSNSRILSSSYQELFGDQFVNIAIKNYSSTSSLYVTQTEGEDLLFSDRTDNLGQFNALWQSTQYVYVGGAGSRVINRFDGTIDELRLWNDNLSDENIINAAFDPGANYGDTYDSAANNLLIQLSFNTLNTSSIEVSSSIKNESPYKNISATPSLEQIFAYNISGSDFSRYNRSIRQDMIIVGSSGYLTNKIKVAADAVFIGNDTETKRLYRNKSIVSPQQKRVQQGRNKVIIASSPTEIINQNIIRNFGYENINAILGAPTTLYNTFDKSLSSLKRFYQQYYYVNVNFNRFVRILSELSSVLNEVVDYFIPSKSTMLKGIVIEPNILEQVKIAPVKNIRLYGKNSRKTLNAAGSLTSSAPDYGATFTVSKEIESQPSVTGNYATYQTQESIDTVTIQSKLDNYLTAVEFKTHLTGSTSNLKTDVPIESITVAGTTTQYQTQVQQPTLVTTGSVNNLKSAVEVYTEFTPQGTYSHYTSSIDSLQNNALSGVYNTYTASHNIGLDVMNKITYNDINYGSEGAEPYRRLYTRKLFSYEITNQRSGGDTSMYIPALYTIPPSADFRDVGVYTYFDNSFGIYYFPEIQKTPAYPKPLNAKWDDSNQSFTNAVTWSYGGRYNIYDVVYQKVTSKNTELGSLTGSVLSGNNRYYVFKNRPAYKPTEDGTAFYSGSVPSFIPPSLDRENWDVLRFTPTEKQVPKRIVFDIFNVSDPSINNFKTTTISVNKIIDTPDRYIDSFNAPIVQGNSYVTGEITAQNIMLLFAVQTNISGLRFRVYRTAEARDADISRPFETRPTDAHKVLLDMPFTKQNSYELINPITTLVADGLPPAGKLYYTLDNLESTAKLGITVLLYYFAVQIEPRIPQGYLRKHYRFFRDNSTATKRRNYDGCKNTQDTSIDGLPVVQVFLSEGTDLVISPTQTNQEIITGGGGQLNVT